VAEKLLGFVKAYKQYLTRFGGSFDDNPTPGNKAGGLTTILEKSLGGRRESRDVSAQRRPSITPSASQRPDSFS